MLFATLLLIPASAGLSLVWSPLAFVPFAVWLWVLSFFRDPLRERSFAPGELCSPADGKVTEITELPHHDTIGGPALRVGIFLSIFNCHINRWPCAGTVRTVEYRKGEFLDARHVESGHRNESNTIVLDPDPPVPGPVVLRQVAGKVARRIICHAQPGMRLPIGARFGLIKFGSRTELIVPRGAGTQAAVRIGDKVAGGLTVLVRQSAPGTKAQGHEGTMRREERAEQREAEAPKGVASR